MDARDGVSQRTLLGHQEFQLRDAAHINARNLAKAVDEGSLRVGVVMQVNRYGSVLIDDYSNSEDGGEWMAVIGRAFPRIGNTVLYGMVNSSPVIIGVIPDEYDPYWISSPDYVYEIEHFLLTQNLVSGATGQVGSWGFSSVGASINRVTTPGIGTPEQGNGWIVMTTTATSGNRGLLLANTAINPISMYTLNMFEAGILINATGSQFARIGITDSLVIAGNNGINFTYDSSVGANWMVQGFNNSSDVFGAVDTGYAAEANKLLCVRFTKLAEGVWEVHYRVPLDQGEPVSVGIFEGLPNATVNLGIAIYNRAALARSLYVDYVAWAVEGMAGVF